MFNILLSSLRLNFGTVVPVFWGQVRSTFEAISEMTCFLHIFKQFSFVMQMDVTLSISRKADTCGMDRLKLWWSGVLTAVKDCNVNWLWWGGCFTASPTQFNHTHTWFTNRCTHILWVLTFVPQCFASSQPPNTYTRLLPGLPTARKNLQHICPRCISSSCLLPVLLLLCSSNRGQVFAHSHTALHLQAARPTLM